MNYWMVAATALLVLTNFVHLFLGGPEIHHVIQQSELAPSVRGVAAVLWHAVTVILAVFAIACAYLATHRNPALAYVMVAVQVGFSALFVYYGLALLGTLWIMPQWTIFLTISVVTAIGARGPSIALVVAR
ncbi:hypothetical protein [Shimia sp. Alg240-R146]|uniref:hypothetical protein n=1 Tax=Shimia sp. Alg240-R146 TaxID=2993449 RepID=UPI0022E29C78|nr:hypothetical protein [Shimia sp. Alg240-R146]